MSSKIIDGVCNHTTTINKCHHEARRPTVVDIAVSAILPTISDTGYQYKINISTSTTTTKADVTPVTSLVRSVIPYLFASVSNIFTD